MKINLKTAINYHENQIASRSLNKKLNTDVPMTLLALAKEETISPESSACQKLIYITEGILAISFEENHETAYEGDLVVIEPMKNHGLKAISNCKILQIELS